MDGFIGRINATHRSADNKWQMGANISLSKQKSSVVSEGTAFANPFFLLNYVITPNIRSTMTKGTMICQILLFRLISLNLIL